MRDPKRIEIILNLLKELWESSPDLRFLQLVENIVFCHTEYCFYHMEDDLLSQMIKDYKQGGKDNANRYTH